MAAGREKSFDSPLEYPRVKTYIGLFRGINVVGRHMVPMKDLRLALDDAARLSEQLAAAVSGSHGFEPRVLVRTLAELERAAADNPFPEADDDPKSLHLSSWRSRFAVALTTNTRRNGGPARANRRVSEKRA